MLIKQLLSFAETGSTAVLYMLIGLSVLSVAITVDRWLWFRRRRVDAISLGSKMIEMLRRDDLAGARVLMRETVGVEAEVMTEALSWYEDGPDSVAEIVGSKLRALKKQFEGGLLFLGTLGNNSPFVGLFGTVLGIVVAFRELGNAGASGAMGNVMGGIAEALVSTAVGILVALPAVVAYNIFQKKAAQIEENIEALGNQLLAHMKSTRHTAHTHLAPLRKKEA